MSFSSDVKGELCRAALNRTCCVQAEMYGVLLYCNTFSVREIKIVTENRAFASRLPKLIKNAFGFAADNIGESGGKSVFSVSIPEKMEKVFETYGCDADKLLAHHLNFSVLEDECCRVSFLRGAFLAGGSVTDPEKRYHLELVTDHFNVNREVDSILLDMGFEPKSTDRNGNYMLYFKSSEAIEDFLTTVGAPLAAMNVMSAKIEKDLRNSVNRRVNCDTANVGKTVDAAMEQVEAIRRLALDRGLESLPDKLQEAARLRLDNPEASLRELAELAKPTTTKSGMNHRLRKLIELSVQ